MKLKKMIKVMEHFKNGGEVEYLVKEDDYSSWIKCVNPLWDWFDYNYRIKEPKQKVTIEKWLCQNNQEEFIAIETSNIDGYGYLKKIKLIESYEVES